MAVRTVLVACTLAAVASASRAGDPGWEPSLVAALQKARQTGKPVLVDVYAEWCGPCKKLAGSLRDPQVAAALGRGFVAVKVDADRDEATVRKYKVAGLPTLLVLSADGAELARTSGAMSPADLTAWLGKVGAKAKPPTPAPGGDEVGRQLDAVYAELSVKLRGS
jgi:thioredoxin-like negative regulator of GroEL